MKVSSHTVPAEPNFRLELPCDARILSFQLTVTNPVIELFVLGDYSGPARTRTFRLIETYSDVFEDCKLVFIGSFHAHTGVSYHLFETFLFETPEGETDA